MVGVHLCLTMPISLQADNDFISTQGISLGQPFDAGLDVDNQFMVFRVTLPGGSATDVFRKFIH